MSDFRNRWGKVSGLLFLAAATSGCAFEMAQDSDELSAAYDDDGDESLRERKQEIIYGTVVPTANTRYRAVAHLEFSKNGYSWECGGTLVQADWVASAAHCFYAPAAAKLAPYSLTDADFRNKANWKVTLNRYDETTANGQQRAFKNSPIIHSSFVFTPLGTRPFQGLDVAVVQLSSTSSYPPLRLVGEKQMAAVNTGGITSPDAGLGDRVTAVGWGLTESGTTTQLREVQLGLTGVGSQCYDPPGFLGGAVNNNEVCVWWYLGLGNVNSGDSGGPSLLTIGGVDQVVGITSWGYTAAGVPVSPGVLTRAGSVASWVESTITGNYYLSGSAKTGWSVLNSTSLTRARFVVGDFDGNGKDDLLYTYDGTTWAARWAGAGNWVDVATDTAAVSSMLVGDYNGDGKSDILIAEGSGWHLRSGASGARTQLSTATETASKLLVGDFDGDGKSDILYANGTNWRVRYKATGAWVTVRNETAAKANLLIADVDGNGKDDVIITDGTNWKVSKSATAAPTNLTTSSVLAKDLVVADFDGNGKDDVLYADGSTFRVKYGGTGNWVTTLYTGGKANFLLTGRFDSTTGADVLQMVR